MTMDGSGNPEKRDQSLSDNAMRVLEERYFLRDEDGKVIETPDELFWRVARSVAAAEEDPADETIVKMFHDIMARLDFLPNSPTLMNAGRQGGQLAACFVLPVEDSMEGIFDSLKHMALIHKSGGGTGYNFSELRPRGDKVSSTNGVASGPVSFMGMFDHATEVVMQGGMRRGANMGILNADHPDVFDFIKAKTEEGKLVNFNISVGVTDDFMRAVENDGYWDLKNPRTREVVRTVKARELMALICEMAWKTGDPGMVFLDKLNRDNPLAHLGPITSTNPCVTGDTIVHTVEGPKRARDLCGRKIGLVVNGKVVPSSGEGFFKTGEKSVLRLETREGFRLRLTADHPVLKVGRGTGHGEDLEWTAAGSLRPGDRIKINNHRSGPEWPGPGTAEEGYLAGLRAGGGDGSSMPGGDNSFSQEMETGTSSSFAGGFLRGLFEAKGSVGDEQEKGASLYLGRCSLPALETAQRMLLRLGIVGTIRGGGDEGLPSLQPGWPELVVSGASARLFAERVGFEDQGRQDELLKTLGSVEEGAKGDPFTATIGSIAPDGVEEVFDTVVPGENAFDANGLVVHNCGEQPLLPYEACNLGSINLGGMVEDGKVDWEKLRLTTRLAVRFLDDVIDVNRYPLPRIEDMVKMTRKIGLGVMGWADMLFQLRIPYDSEEALDLGRSIMEAINAAGRQESAALALSRGACPALPDSGLRNSTITTIAPTGSLSMIADCSSGIEPVFALEFTKEVLEGKRFSYRNRYYVEALERGESPATVARVFKTSHQIAPEWHVKMQSAFQEYVDNAVSKTINMPNSATVEDVEKAYILAWKTHCKGITVFRDGCRSGQVLYVDKPAVQQALPIPQVLEVDSPMERPFILGGKTAKIPTSYGNLYLTVNEVNGRPVEVFTTMGKSGHETMAFTEAIGRLISLSLRSGVRLHSIIKQMKGIGGSQPVWHGDGVIMSVPDAIAYGLLSMGYLDMEEKGMMESLSDTDMCPVCGASMTRQEGCIKCPACGFSRC